MGKEQNFGDKQTSEGFQKNPENINRKGRPKVKPLRDFIDETETKGGVVSIPLDICEIDQENGVVKVKLPTKEAVAIALQRKAVKDIRWFDAWAKVMGEYAPKDFNINQNVDIEPTQFTIIDGRKH